MTAITHNRIGCSNAAYRRTCGHIKTYGLDVIIAEVIKKVDEQLTGPEVLKRRIRARVLELAKAKKAERVALRERVRLLGVPAESHDVSLPQEHRDPDQAHPKQQRCPCLPDGVG